MSSSSKVARDLHKIIQTAYETKLTGVAKVSTQEAAYWRMYFMFGRLVWISDRAHALRRWKRHITICSPALAQQIDNRPDLSHADWNYTALATLVKAKQFPENQFSNIIESVVTENLFDILQVATVQSELKPSAIPAATFNTQPHQASQGNGSSTSSTNTFSSEFIPKALTDLPFVVMNHNRAWREAKDSWQDWMKADLTNICPDWGLAIRDFDKLRVRTSPQTLKTIRACCNGQYALRDLAIAFRQPAIFFIQSMLPYISEQMVALTEIPDLPAADFNHGFAEALTRDTSSYSPNTLVEKQVSQQQPAPAQPVLATPASAKSASARPASENTPQHHAAETHATGARTAKTRTAKTHTAETHTAKTQTLSQPARRLISRITPRKSKRRQPSPTYSSAPKVLYIDDSPIDSRTMAQIVEKLGYQYANISDAIQALPLLIEAKPDLIFLDLVMPVANGYEICAQIRRISAFKKTPVIIVTSNDGVADRVRAKLVGASGFLGKPIREKKVAKALKKHLGDFRPTSVQTESHNSPYHSSAQTTSHTVSTQSSETQGSLAEQPLISNPESAAPNNAEQQLKKQVEAKSKNVLFSG